jgi:superfamily II DNA helicase RecQ
MNDNPPPSPSSALPVYVCKSYGGNKNELLSFNLSVCGIVMCMHCRDVIDLGGKTIKEASGAVASHWNLRRETVTDPQTGAKHPAGVSASVFRDFAQSQLLPGQTTIPQRGVILYQALFEWEPLRTLYASEEKKSITICSYCMREKKAKIACCSVGREITVDAYCKKYFHAIPVMSSAQLVTFYEERERLTTPPPPPPPLPSSAASSLLITPPVTHQHSATGPSTDVVPFSLASSENPYIVDALASAKKRRIFVSESNMASASVYAARTLKMMQPEQLRLLNSSDTNSLLYSVAYPTPENILRHNLLMGNNRPTLKQNVDPQRSTDTKQNHLMEIFFHDRDFSPDESLQIKYAKASALIDISNGQDAVLLEACTRVITLGANLSTETQGEVKLQLNEFMFRSSGLSSRNVDETDAHVARNGGFPRFIPERTVNAYARILARLVRVILRLQLSLSQVLSQYFEGNTKIPAQSGPIAEWNLGNLPSEIAVAVYQLCVHQGEANITQYLGPFVFKDCSRTDSVPDGTSGDSDGDSDNDEPDTDDEGGDAESGSPISATANTYGTRTVTELSRIASSMLLFFKLSLLIHMDTIKRSLEEYNQRARFSTYSSDTSIGNEMPVIIPNVLDSILKIENSPFPNAVALAQVINRCRLLKGANPSLMHRVAKKTAADGEIIITRREHVFDAMSFESCGAGLLRLCQSSLSSCLQLTNGDERNKVWGWIIDPIAKELSIEAGNNQQDTSCALLNLTTPGATLILNKATTSASADVASRKRFADNCEILRDVLIASIQYFGGTVMRARELQTLQLATKKGYGNLFHATTLCDVPTLAFVGIISKTGLEGFAVLPHWVSRLILVLLQILNPLLVGGLVEQAKETISASSSADDDGLSTVHLTLSSSSSIQTVSPWNENAFRKQIAGEVSTCLGTRAVLSPVLLKALRDGGSYSKIPPLKQITINKVRSIVADRIGSGLKSDVCFQETRHVLLVFKTCLLEFLQERSGREGMTAEQKNALTWLGGIQKSVAQRSTGIIASAGVGMHSARTNLNSYQAPHVLGCNANGPSIVDDVSFRNSQLMECSLGLFVKTPIKRHDSLHISANGRSPTFYTPNTSMYEKLVKQRNEQGLSIRSEEQVINRVQKQTFEMTQWSCEEQQNAAKHILMSRTETTLLFLPCGMGKTVAYLNPLSLAPVGFSIVIVPYISLLDSQLEYANTRLDLRCEAFDIRNKSRFSATSFDHVRNLNDPIRFVYVVVDTAVRPEFTAFVDSANARGLLNAIVFDEAHQILQAERYRENMKRVGHFSTFGVPLIFASGTFPPCFEPSLLDKFGLFKNLCAVFRRPDSYGKRLTVHLVAWKDDLNQEDLDTYVYSVLRNRRKRSPNDNRLVLLYSMTKAGNTSLANKIRNSLNNAKQTGEVVALDSETEIDQRREFFKGIVAKANDERTTPLYVCCTSMAAEGVDFPNVGFIMVCGGTFGGVLLVHQMFNRAGRGIPEDNQGNETPEAMLVYTPKYIANHVFQGQNGIHQHDQNSLKPFLIGDRSKVSPLISIGGLETLFKDQGCAGTRMEKALGIQETSERCEKCSGCRSLSDCSIPEPPKIQMSCGAKKMTQGETLPNTIPIRSENGDVDRNLVVHVRDFLSKLGRNCFFCNGSGPCYPNKCSRFKALYKQKKGCFFCFNPGHSIDQVNEALTTVRGQPDKEYEHHLVAKCAIVTMNCKAHKHLKPCPKCWMSHCNVDDSKSCSIVNENAHIARSIAIIVWNDLAIRNDFFNVTNITEQNKPRTWTQFFRWLVYEGNGRKLNNIYILLSFFAGM